MLQEMAAHVVDGNDPVTGHIISTTIGGKNGEPKQVWSRSAYFVSRAFPTATGITKL